MVRVVNLDEDGCEDETQDRSDGTVATSSYQDAASSRPNPNYDLLFSAALSCYPVISSIASNVDLTTLHELSRTCRQARANLLQYRTTLKEQTLRCANENAHPAARLGDALQASYQQWTSYARTGETIDRVSGGRNCVMKQPTPNVLKGRFRRLCRKCMKSNIEPHTLAAKPADEDVDSHEKLVRSPCTCDEIPWICRPCGQTLRTTDTTYMRGWAWRTRYGACGGIGAGLGEGNEGVECGRGGACLNARIVEKEVELDPKELAALEVEMEKTGLDARTFTGNSFLTCEVVGIGGTVQRKIKKSILVGAIVKEYEDERATSKFLQREQDRLNRSWCSWCDRVVLSKKDADQPARSTDSVASSSSEGSI
ncbi:uncharacterized protein LTR77_009591 [Saxophila tyrrhenica]|uniref:Uncharacterized protein n=1 Tax=Saxophila tyrrhenica TaxID=1690608 RepID=A0AAV9NY88_9PEZI|nr:hypothetical protein LTR77_009591 [Saxophila tyrrhenica]